MFSRFLLISVYWQGGKKYAIEAFGHNNLTDFAGQQNTTSSSSGNCSDTNRTQESMDVFADFLVELYNFKDDHITNTYIPLLTYLHGSMDLRGRWNSISRWLK